ncbi:MAG: hypothetical protein RTU30_13130, partial [Candidatus Thorarchaeota archaeon]
QQKYDIYPSLTGIDFLIFSETNYTLWLDGSGAIPHFERTDINELSWNVKITHSGVWYIVYSNNGIARKRIHGTFQIVGSINPLEIGLILGSISVVFLVGVLYRQRYRSS